jgi:hypothetical protein
MSYLAIGIPHDFFLVSLVLPHLFLLFLLKSVLHLLKVPPLLLLLLPDHFLHHRRHGPRVRHPQGHILLLLRFIALISDSDLHLPYPFLRVFTLPDRVLRLRNDNLLLEHSQHLLLPLPLSTLLHNRGSIPWRLTGSRSSFCYLVKSLLNLELFHFPLEFGFVALRSFLDERLLATLDCLFGIESVLVFFLGLHDALLSLLLFGLIESTLLQFVELVLKELRIVLYDHSSCCCMEPGVCVVNSLESTVR